MITEKIARKRLAVGRFSLEPGDTLSDEVEALLPPGRLKILVERGWLSERPVAAPLGLDRLEAMVVEQQAQVDSLMERVVALESRRGPGRPRKDEG